MKGQAVEVIVFGVILVIALIILILFHEKVLNLAVDFVNFITKAAESLFWDTVKRIVNPFD